MDACQTVAKMKYIPSNGFDRSGYADRGQTVTIVEGNIPNAFDRVGNGNSGQAGATKECAGTNGFYRVRNEDIGQITTGSKCRLSDRSNGAGDDSSLTSQYQLIGFRLNDRIAVSAAVIHAISLVNADSDKTV